MVAYNFMERWAGDVEDGTKTQTIRSKARAKPSDKLQFYTGQRTKDCRSLGEGVCTKVTAVTINATDMVLGGRQMLAGSCGCPSCPGCEDECDNEFAKADGFDGFVDMADFFREKYGLPFDGFVTEWRKL